MELLQALSDWPVAVVLRRSMIAYLLVNAAHIFSIGLLVGAIVTLDLRVLGLFKRYPIAVLGPPLSHMAIAGVTLAILTGFLLFTVRPTAYVQNSAFLVKIGLVGLGIVNALMVNYNRHWRLALAGGEMHLRVQIAALLSIALWAGAVIAGRWIGFL
ncbi:DUF2214 domain-containing protein [Phyllobacterium phragmitis]|uniref:DUF2214 domain-containing protein n=1 Tax=Phyllobacterium phragmitis TaxID=2670329 RepID=A0A2S9IN32_9HYPH|nr:DUF2214 domain-containing protein [Phyllobacterium phragmitis]PRD41917.1 DUF2214 domain-containing protein [Phyllobacterium phragmitis]